MEPDELTAFAHSVFNAQPFSRFIGAELVAVSRGTAEIRVKNRPDLQQQHGYLHGGVISYLADNALTFAGGLALGGDALTSEYKINYASPAKGDTIIARAESLVTTKRQAVCQCSIYSQKDGEEQLVAVAQGTIVAIGNGAKRPA